MSLIKRNTMSTGVAQCVMKSSELSSTWSIMIVQITWWYKRGILLYVGFVMHVLIARWIYYLICVYTQGNWHLVVKHVNLGLMIRRNWNGIHSWRVRRWSHLVKPKFYKNLQDFRWGVRTKTKFFFLNQNICCGSHWDGSFEYPKHMFELMGKKIFTILRSIFLFI